MKLKATILTAFMCILTSASCFADTNYNKWSESYNFRRGVEAVYNGDEQEAFKYLNAEINEHEDNGYAWGQLAYIFLNKGDNGHGLTCINKAIKYTDNKDTKAQSWNYETRASIYVMMNDSTQAISDYNQAVSIDPKNIEIIRDRGKLYIQYGRYQEALNDFSSVLDLEPKDTAAWIEVGYCHNKLGDTDKAISCYNTALSINENYAWGNLYRAEAYIINKQYEAATKDLIIALGNTLTEDEAFNDLRDLLKSQPEIAQPLVEAQCKKDSTNMIWPYILALKEELCENYAEAQKYFSESFNIDANSQTAFHLSKCNVALCNYEEALKNIDQAISINSNMSFYISYKAHILCQMNKNKEALEAINQYINVEPENGNAYFQRGWYKSVTGDKDGAIEDYSMATALDTTHMRAHINRAILLAEQGKTDEAMKIYQYVIENDSTPVSFNTAYAQALSGHMEKANEIFNDMLINANDNKKGEIYYTAACINSLVDNKGEAINYLQKAFETSFASLGYAQAQKDTELSNISNLNSYKSLIKEYTERYNKAHETN